MDRSLIRGHSFMGVSLGDDPTILESLKIDQAGRQDSFLFRALKRGLQWADHLIDGAEMPSSSYYLWGSSDGLIDEQQTVFLKLWNTDQSFKNKIRRFSLPLFHKGAEEVIRTTLGHFTGALTDSDVQKAVIVSCMTPLRQSIGSCFATAPAILVQKNHLPLFVDDLYELLTTGKLRRVIEGKEYAAPINLSRSETNTLLKVWEFTLASFSDIKMEFSKWNLAWSLGLHPHEKGGVGEALYIAFEEKLKKANEKIDVAQQEVVVAFEQLKATEHLLRQASSEAEARRLNAEAQARLYHLRSCETLRDDAQKSGKAYAELFSFLIDQYSAKFQDYFQEVYDPEMHEMSAGPYEDRLAGFRLIYKHGRNDPALWTTVHDAERFIKVLVEFFTTTEPSILHACKTSHEKAIVESMTTLILQHLQSPHFLQAALARANRLNRKPWAYLSGGTMDQLIPVYFRCSSPLKKESREIADELELFVFLLDTLKAFPETSELLIQSPTHAFTLLPQQRPFRDGWQNSGFTYTWIRDYFMIPARQFYADILLDTEQKAEVERRLSIYKESASGLYQTLPLIRADKCKAVLQNLLGTDKFSLPSLPAFLSSEELQLLAKALVPTPHEIIAERARALKLAPPAILFADTNWPSSYFSFVINPATLELEVWKTDKTATKGSPLPLVKSWLGKGKDFVWTIYTNKI